MPDPPKIEDDCMEEKDVELLLSSMQEFFNELESNEDVQESVGFLSKQYGLDENLSTIEKISELFERL